MNYEEKLLELALHNDKILVLTAENRASIRNLPNILKKRFIDIGISEQSLIGISAGLSLRSNIPVVHAIAAFLTMRAFEFIRTDIGYPNLNVKLVGNFAGFLSEANGPTHQSLEDISLMRGIPNMNIFVPGDIDDLIKGISTIINYNKPFYIRYNDRPAEIEHSQFALGKAEIFGDGTDVGIFTYGTLFTEAYQTFLLLNEKGLSTRLINLRTLKPIDEIEIIRTMKLCKTIVSIEDHFIVGGLNSILSEIIAREKIVTELLSISLDNSFFKPAKLKDAINYEGFSVFQLTNKIIDFLSTKGKKFNVEWSTV
jgi:transketolase